MLCDRQSGGQLSRDETPPAPHGGGWGPDGRNDGDGARGARAARRVHDPCVPRESGQRLVNRARLDALQAAALGQIADELRQPRRLHHLLLPHTRLPRDTRVHLQVLHTSGEVIHIYKLYEHL